MAYAFLISHKKNKPLKGDWGNKILKDVIRVAQTTSYQKMTYLGNGMVLAQMIYKALGMKEDLKEMSLD